MAWMSTAGLGCASTTDDPEAALEEEGATAVASELSGSTILSQARQRLGKPYVYGAVGPAGYDCSGLVQTVFHNAGRSLPRVAQAQYDASHKISASSRAPGDLVFFGSPDGIYHVGIYVGSGQMIDAPHTGAVVRQEGVWAGAHYGRIY